VQTAAMGQIPGSTERILVYNKFPIRPKRPTATSKMAHGLKWPKNPSS